MVVRLIHTLLPMGRASLANVAQTMGRNVRTLQRELDARGLDFRTLLSDVRDDLAVALLRDPTLTMDEIAVRLGYASDTAFIRAFHTRRGATPGAVRRKASAAPGCSDGEASAE
jgi:AraC-like DNA-binding protein